MMDVAESIEIVEVSPWGQSLDGEFVVIGSYCGDPVTDSLMREAEQRTRHALIGLPGMLGISNPPPITIRPMRRGGVSWGLNDERNYGESIAIVPWFIDSGRAYPRTPGEIRMIVIHEVTHWLLNHADYTGPSHGPVFTAVLVALMMRMDYPASYINHLSLYDIGFDDVESTTDRPSWWMTDQSEGWAMWIPWAIRAGQRYGQTNWSASRIASVIMARHQRYHAARHARRWSRIFNLATGDPVRWSMLSTREEQNIQLKAALEGSETREQVLREQVLSHEKSTQGWRGLALTATFCLFLLGMYAVHS